VAYIQHSKDAASELKDPIGKLDYVIEHLDFMETDTIPVMTFLIPEFLQATFFLRFVEKHA